MGVVKLSTFTSVQTPTMKTFILVLCALCTVATAQQSLSPVRPRVQPGSTESAPLAENFIVSLTISDKEQVVTEMALVVATADFAISFPDVKLVMTHFTGTLVPEESGSVLIRYTIASEIPVPAGQNQVQYKTTSMQASVRLRPGEPIQILKSDTRSCRLSVERLAAPPAKSK